MQPQSQALHPQNTLPYFLWDLGEAGATGLGVVVHSRFDGAVVGGVWDSFGGVKDEGDVADAEGVGVSVPEWSRWVDG